MPHSPEYRGGAGGDEQFAAHQHLECLSPVAANFSRAGFRPSPVRRCPACRTRVAARATVLDTQPVRYDKSVLLLVCSRHVTWHAAGQRYFCGLCVCLGLGVWIVLAPASSCGRRRRIHGAQEARKAAEAEETEQARRQPGFFPASRQRLRRSPPPRRALPSRPSAARLKTIFAKCKDAVVRIEATDLYGPHEGTGFFIDPAGTIYTHYSVAGRSWDHDGQVRQQEVSCAVPAGRSSQRCHDPQDRRHADAVPAHRALGGPADRLAHRGHRLSRGHAGVAELSD